MEHEGLGTGQAVSAFESVSRDELIALVLEQRKTISDLRKRICALEKQLGLDDSDPPSIGSKGKSANANAKANRKKRKPRTSSFVRRRETPTHIVDHFPDTCPDCGRGLCGGGPGRRRQIIDIDPNPVRITEHVLYDRWCGVCRQRVRAQVDFSGLVCGKRRFGHNLVSWIANLHISARVPLRTIQTILKQLYHVHVSVGEMGELMTLLAQQAAGAMEAIKQEVRSSACLHADETGWRENGLCLTRRRGGFISMSEERRRWPWGLSGPSSQEPS